MAERRTPEIKYIKGFGWAMICYGDNRICWDISKENDMDYVKDGTLTIQARTIEEVNSIDRVVVYADGCEREFLMPVANGKWVEEYDEDAPLFLKRRWRCTACNDWQTYGKPKFCPNCGAKMKGETDGRP